MIRGCPARITGSSWLPKRDTRFTSLQLIAVHSEAFIVISLLHDCACSARHSFEGYSLTPGPQRLPVVSDRLPGRRWQRGPRVLHHLDVSRSFKEAIATTDSARAAPAGMPMCSMESNAHWDSASPAEPRSPISPCTHCGVESYCISRRCHIPREVSARQLDPGNPAVCKATAGFLDGSRCVVPGPRRPVDKRTSPVGAPLLLRVWPRGLAPRFRVWLPWVCS